jgi:hypothetical protein
MYDPKTVDIASDEFLKADYIVLANITHPKFTTTLEVYMWNQAKNHATEGIVDEIFGCVYLMLFDRDIKLLDRQEDLLNIIKAAVVTESPDKDVHIETFDNQQDAKDLYEKLDDKYLKYLQEE